RAGCRWFFFGETGLMKYGKLLIVISVALLLKLDSTASAQEVKQGIKLLINAPDEPVAKQMSFARTAEFLDHQARAWTETKKCGTCHTNFPYLMARAQLGGNLTALKEVRGFFENRVANWDSGKKEDLPKRDTEVIATAATLALQDALRSEEHTSELQSPDHLVCRLLLENKKKKK